MRRVVLFLWCLILPACSSSTEEKLVLGHLAPLSGPQRSLGEEQRRGIQLAVEESNQANEGAHSWVVLHVDTKGSLEHSKAEAIRLCSVNRARCLLLGVSASDALELAVTVQQYKVPVMTTAEIRPAAPGPVLSLDVSPQQYAETITTFLKDHLKINQVILLASEKDPFYEHRASEILQQWQKLEGKKGEMQLFGEKAKWNELTGTNSESSAILLAGTASDLRELQKAMKEKKQSAPVIFIGGNQESSKLMASSGTGSQFYLPSIYSKENLTEKGKAFTKKFQKQFGHAPRTEAYQGYEMIQILDQTLQQNQTSLLRKESMTKERVFEGLTGKIVLKGQYAQRALYLLSLQDGKIATVKSYDPPSEKSSEEKKTENP